MDDLFCHGKEKVKANSIQPGEAVLAVRYMNGAWGYQEMLDLYNRLLNMKF